MDIKTHYRLQAALRKQFQWTPTIRQALNRAKIGPDYYLCEGCELVICKRPEGPTLEEIVLYAEQDALVVHDKIAVDHIEPVVDPEVGFVDWNNYINRLFCPVNSLQVLCGFCHYSKTQVENQLRAEVRKGRRNE